MRLPLIALTAEEGVAYDMAACPTRGSVDARRRTERRCEEQSPFDRRSGEAISRHRLDCFAALEKTIGMMSAAAQCWPALRRSVAMAVWRWSCAQSSGSRPV
jgi:hypothetical protein